MSTSRGHRRYPTRRAGTIGASVAVLVAAMVMVPQAFGGTLTSRSAASLRAGSSAAGNAAGGTGGECADVHIIATRASTEAPGAGIIGSLVDAVESASSQSISTDTTDYPATLSRYASSVAEGVESLTELLTTQAENCPDQQLVLMGYSQGAHVTGDVLAGGSGLGSQTPPIDASVVSQVSAVILMGDPTHVAGSSFDAGTARTDGRFPRDEDQSLEDLADRIQSYCDTGDTFCASGGSIVTHLGYTRKYNDQALDFVLAQIGG